MGGGKCEVGGVRWEVVSGKWVVGGGGGQWAVGSGNCERACLPLHCLLNSVVVLQVGNF